VARPAFAIVLIAGLLAGCGSGPSGGPGEDERSVQDLPGDTSSRGASLVGSSGCLGCHKLGEAGNDGPGPELTDVGGRLSRAEIADVLVNPQPPMPSYEDLPDAERDAIVDYLAALR
jgi:mono/diheme cytochrome c family protein